MNKFWFLMMLSSICVLLITNPAGTLNGMISATTSVTQLCFELVAVYTVWLGFLDLVEKSGLSEKISKLLRPITRKLIKTTDVETEKIIALNLSANMLGLGNAATPLGIKAMQKLDNGGNVASASMIMLIIINVTSIQLLPTTVIGLRESAGSLSAGDIIIPSLIATFITTSVGIILAIICEKYLLKRKKKS